MRSTVTLELYCCAVSAYKVDTIVLVGVLL